ncbi:MAG TPA: hypothetical protein VFB45_15300 [Pseudolabrys sp.]|nr:hypothetical protein [Pseudolabrys sp.]
MKDPAILFCKPQAIDDASKAALTKAGVIVVEVAEPHDVKLVRPMADLPGSTLLRIAAETIMKNGTDSTRERFGWRVCEALTTEKDA